MEKSTIRVRTKILAKTVLSENFIKIFVALVLEALTGRALSYLYNGLAEKFFNACTLTVGPYTFYYAVTAMSVAGSIFLIPLQLGIAEYLLLLVRKRSPRFGDIFLWYGDSEKFRRVLSYWLWTALFSLVSVPMLTVTGDYLLQLGNDITAAMAEQMKAGAEVFTMPEGMINYAYIFVSLALMALYGLISVKFAPMPYLLADGRAKNAFSAAAQSWKLMRGHTFEYILLVLSFFMWYIGLAFTAFILAVYFVPYFRMTKIIFIEYLRAEKDLKDADEHR